MTNKSARNVIKGGQKPKSTNICQVVKHFEPKLVKTCEIPPVNNDIDMEEIFPRQFRNVPRNRKKNSALKSHSINCNTEQSLPPKPRPQRPSTVKYCPRRIQSCKSDSSSSLEPEKITNLQKKRAKSSPSKQQGKGNPQSPREFVSVTDPTLLQRQLNLKNLKEEIHNYKNRGLIKADTSVEVKNLHNEIYQTKNRNILQKQILITELKTEIAEYKKVDSYYVYDTKSEQQRIFEKDTSSRDVTSNKNRGPERSDSQRGYRETLRDGLSESERESLSTVSDQLENRSMTLTNNSDLSGERHSSTADSLDNETLKNKIDEANTLINRIKNALEQIKKMKISENVFVNDLKTETQNLLTEMTHQPSSTERPKTRRSENEDGLLNSDKFKTIPEIEQIEVTSSIEALQMKLHTISESTESRLSTPRTHEVTKPCPKELVSTGCNTEEPILMSKQVQVSVETKNVETQGYNPALISVGTQVPQKVLTLENFDVLTIPGRTRPLEQQHFQVQDIKPMKNALKVENQDPHCIAPNYNAKLGKLTIQSLPSVIIPRAPSLTQTLNFSINSDGVSKNYLKNSSNVTFLEINNDPDIHRAPSASSKHRIVPNEKFQGQSCQYTRSKDKDLLGAKLLQEPSAIDIALYKTFINPDGFESKYSLMSRTSKDFVFDEPVHKCYGMESKEIQCTDSTIMKEQEAAPGDQHPEADVTASEVTLTLSYSTEKIIPSSLNSDKNIPSFDKSLPKLYKSNKKAISRNNKFQYSNHLEIASNGRYKDEANLFCESQYRKPTKHLRRQKSDLKSSTNDVRAKEQLEVKNRKHFRHKHCTNVAKRQMRNIQKVTVEQRRNYFNNWVTYYIT